DAVTLMYSGGKLSFTAILPKQGTLAQLEQTLDVKALDAILDARMDEQVHVRMPRFRLQGESVSLIEPFRAMGMVHAFADADFSGISRSMPLVIQDIFHKAFIDVAEKGTEAAAATAVVFRDSGIAFAPKSIVLDHPFLVLIRDEPTGAILFTARVAKP